MNKKTPEDVAFNITLNLSSRTECSIGFQQTMKQIADAIHAAARPRLKPQDEHRYNAAGRRIA